MNLLLCIDRCVKGPRSSIYRIICLELGIAGITISLANGARTCVALIAGCAGLLCLQLAFNAHQTSNTEIGGPTSSNRQGWAESSKRN